ncbi:MAG: GNAT family N-acetyltransferase [Bryobacteraceae bacterium]|nr:GNAT family N-acetyltransferase [Bryobacteraceae bacterium]
MNIRQAAEADATTIVEFNRAMARETEDRELALETITPGVARILTDAALGFYLVAEAEGAVIGCLMVTYEWSDWRNGLFWWVQSVYVDPAWRGRGVYRALYGETKARARAMGGVCGFRLYVEENNVAAQETYKRQGMERTHYLMFEELLETSAPTDSSITSS